MARYYIGDELENMNDCIKVTLVANAGVLIEHNDIGLLVDGIHHEPGHPFSPVSEIDMKHMRQGSDIFSNIDYLLFTHEHPDHFTPQYVAKHIRFRPVQGLFLPNGGETSPRLALLLYQVQKLNIPHWTLGLEPGETQRFTIADDLTVTVIGTRHMGPQYATIKNDCFLLTLAGRNLLFTGDADHVRDYFTDGLAGVELDGVFVNPLFYHHPSGQEIIHDIFRPRHVVIYHMPFEQDDTMCFSSIVQKDIQRLGRPGVQVHVLNGEKQSLSFPVTAAQ